MDGVFNNGVESSSEIENNSSNKNSTSKSEEFSLPTEATSTYNFVPGDQIIFEDDLSKDEDGEFPSRWELLKGNATNTTLEGIPIIRLDQKSIISPLINENIYLQEAFTLEFDAYFTDTHSSWQSYNVRFFSGVAGSAKVEEKLIYPLRIYNDGAKIKLVESNNNNHTEFKNTKESLKGSLPRWKHIAISYNKKSLKVFLENHGVLSIPNIAISPEMVSIEAFTQVEGIRAIKNIRIAKGGKDFYKRIMTEGKFVTQGILFDTNKAVLKFESMGVIKEIAQLMKTHPSLKFRIEGHTDSDGEELHNIELSRQRA